MDSGRPHWNSGRRTIHWLENQGYLRSQTDAGCLVLFHLILLILEPVKGYWILTGWYQLFLPGWRMKIPDDGDWEGHFGKFVCLLLLPVGIFVFLLKGVTLVISTVVRLHELCIWRPKEQSDTANLREVEGKRYK